MLDFSFKLKFEEHSVYKMIKYLPTQERFNLEVSRKQNLTSTFNYHVAYDRIASAAVAERVENKLDSILVIRFQQVR